MLGRQMKCVSSIYLDQSLSMTAATEWDPLDHYRTLSARHMKREVRVVMQKKVKTSVSNEYHYRTDEAL